MRLKRLCQFLLDVPFVGVSATLPSIHRDSLCEDAGFRSDPRIINLGNYRPELSTLIVYMQYAINSFQDIAFLVPPGLCLQDISKTLIYCNDTDLLTEMYWWLKKRLKDEDLPPHLVEILHAGLTNEHEESALGNFRDQRTLFLLATEKVGVGMNFIGQRGHLVQNENNGTVLTGVGYLIVETSMVPEDGNIRNLIGTGQDAGLVTLVQPTDTCLTLIYDHFMENLPRPGDSVEVQCTCCSVCDPQLLPQKQWTWISTDPSAKVQSAAIKISVPHREQVLLALKTYHLDEWRKNWRVQYPQYGPNSIIPDVDMDYLAANARSIKTVSDLEQSTHIIHLNHLGCDS
ncbi:hypothetical protein PM082_017712 [Marasmius tenuissimus]|nr:hypothetical protein PM082_017712 [Marasmius tenuissimus]